MGKGKVGRDMVGLEQYIRLLELLLIMAEVVMVAVDQIMLVPILVMVEMQFMLKVMGKTVYLVEDIMEQQEFFTLPIKVHKEEKVELLIKHQEQDIQFINS